MIDEQEVLQFLRTALLITGMVGPLTFFEAFFDNKNKVRRKKAFVYLFCWTTVLVLLCFIGTLELALIALCTGLVVGFSMVVIGRILYRR
jgi:fluoride ion exporter CrcB/FEX